MSENGVECLRIMWNVRELRWRSDERNARDIRRLEYRGYRKINQKIPDDKSLS
jgi:U3 small nucleolar RNA-associated protein 14